MIRKAVLATFTAAVALTGTARAQGQAPAAAAAQPPALEVGAAAPDFALPGATRYGVLDQPVRLSDFRDKTVILAFFPRARTRGCTIQMHSYRDKYSQLFNNGQDVILIAISGDPADTLAAWARDDQFQFLMAGDVGLETARKYGAISSRGTSAARNLFVIRDGKVAHRMVPFREIDPTSYDELGKVLAQLTGAGTPKSGD